MALSLRKLPFENVEFQMFVIDELCDRLNHENKNIIKLTLGKSELPLAKEIKQVFVNKIYDKNDSLLVYPQGLPSLREAIVEYYKSKQYIINTENIIINTGTSPLYKDLFRLVLEKDDEILLPRPYYSLYLFSAIFSDATIRYYNINLKNGKIDFESFKKFYSPQKTKIVVLNSPGNPLGNIISEEEFSNILNIVNKNSFILCDEIYNNVYFDDKPLSMLKYFNDNNIIVSNSFSKGFRMYTKRVGYLVIPKNLVFPFRVLQQHTLLTVDPVTQFACIEALKREKDDVAELCRIYKERRDYTVDCLNSISDIELIIPKGGFYFTIICSNFLKKHAINSSIELAKDILHKKGVGVVPGEDFGIEDSIRLSFTNSKYKQAIDIIKDYFTNK